MSDEKFAPIRARRQNIRRYRGLLGTSLSDLERQFIERRLSEERSALEALTTPTFPVVFVCPNGPVAPRRLEAAS